MTALYRKYRPQVFDEVVGQESIVTTLRNAIETDRVRQAYLFAGPRGTGKTSLARILAKSLNCEQGPTVTPCGTCASCVSIAAGSSLDVIEMDAASQRGIDDVREIRERAILQPTARYKVYILDEAHQLTKDAFNALLKIIEEPPPHLVFVFCTTELDKMLPTVRSRCQTFLFSRPRLSELHELLSRISQEEGIEAADGALAQIARAARGSFRDGVSTLDQLASATGGTVTLNDALELLGAIEEESLMRLIDLVIDGDTAGALGLVEDMSEEGHDLGRLVTDLLEHLRHLMLLQHLEDVPDTLPISADARERVRSQATQLGEQSTLRLIDLLAVAVDDLRQGGDPRLPLELALVKVTSPQADPSREAILLRLDRLEQGTAVPPGTAPVAAAPATETVETAEPQAPPADAPPAAPDAAATASAETEAQPPEPQASSAQELPPMPLEAVTEAWSSTVLPSLGEHSRATATVLSGTRPIELEDERLVVELPAEASFQRQVAEDPKNRALLGKILHEATGRRLDVAFVVAEAPPEPVAQSDQEPEEQDAPEPVETPSEEEIVSLLKTTFDAEEVVPEDDEA